MFVLSLSREFSQEGFAGVLQLAVLVFELAVFQLQLSLRAIDIVHRAAPFECAVQTQRDLPQDRGHLSRRRRSAFPRAFWRFGPRAPKTISVRRAMSAIRRSKLRWLVSCYCRLRWMRSFGKASVRSRCALSWSPRLTANKKSTARGIRTDMSPRVSSDVNIRRSGGP